MDLCKKQIERYRELSRQKTQLLKMFEEENERLKKNILELEDELKIMKTILYKMAR